MSQLPPNQHPPGGYAPGWGQPPQPPQPPAMPPGEPGWGPPGPQGPPPGWGGHPGGGAPPGTPRPSGNRNLVILLVVLVLGLGIGGFFVLQGNDDSKDEAGPADGLRRFVEADGCQALAAATTAHYQQDYVARNASADSPTPGGFVELCEQLRQQGSPIGEPGQLLDVEVLSQQGDTATVRGQIKAGDQTLDLSYPLKVENGQWRIDGTASDAGEDKSGGSAPEDGPIPPPDGGGDGVGVGGDSGASSGGSGGGGSGGAGTVSPDDTVPGDFPPPDVEEAELDANGNSPKDVVSSFWDATNSGDCPTVRDSVTDDSWASITGGQSEEESMAACEADTPHHQATITSVNYLGVYSSPSAAFDDDTLLPDSALVMAESSDAWEGFKDFWLVMEGGVWKMYQ